LRSIQQRTGILVIAAMVAAVLLLSVPGREMSRQVLQDAGHGPVFAIIALTLALMRVPRGTDGARSAADLCRAWVGAVLIGVLTEAIQHFQPGRTVSALDVANDAAGAMLGLALLAIVEARPSPALRATSLASGRGAEPSPASGRGEEPAGGRRRWAWVAVLASLTMLAWQPLNCATAYARRSAEFPVLMQGVRSTDLYFVSCHRCRVSRDALPSRYAHDHDADAVHVRYTRRDKPRLELFEPMPDWRGHDVLAIDLTNPQPRPLHVVLKIQDVWHDLRTDDRLNLHMQIPAETRS
jgi:hypothetical protein